MASNDDKKNKIPPVRSLDRKSFGSARERAENAAKERKFRADTRAEDRKARREEAEKERHERYRDENGNNIGLKGDKKKDEMIILENFPHKLNPARLQEHLSIKKYSKKGFVAGHVGEKPKIPPLYATLVRKEGGDKYVTVTEGRITEIIPQSGDGVKEHLIDKIWQDAPNSNLLYEHSIQTGEMVGISFEVDKNGYVKADPKPTVEVKSTPSSTHFTPPVGRNGGDTGSVFVVLAKLIGAGDTERLEVWHGGSNIEHYHDTPPFHCVGNGRDIFKQYNLAIGQYEYFGIDVVSPLKIIEDNPDIKIGIDGGADLDLIIKTWTLETAPDTTEEVPITITLPSGFETNEDGVHYHAHEDNYGGFGFTGSAGVESGIPQEPDLESEMDGAHKHSISGTINATATIPVRGRQFIQINSTYDTLCWRGGIYMGMYAVGNPNKPALPVWGLTKTIYVYEGPPAPPLAPLP